MTSENSIHIGNMPFMNYVSSVVTEFDSTHTKEITLQARGKLISKAVDVSEVVMSRFLKGKIQVKNISIGSENSLNEEGHEVRVSTIAITLAQI